MLQTSQLTRTLEGIQTDVVFQAFTDQILVLITQLGKVGTLVRLVLFQTAPKHQLVYREAGTGDYAGYCPSSTFRAISKHV
jgi:hypothetical protein